MTYRQALRKKFGAGLLGSLLIYARAWHIFNFYAREYEKTLSDEGRAEFRRFFGE